MEELGIGRPSTYASILAVLPSANTCAWRRTASSPRTRGCLVTAFLESYFSRYVDYDFTADLEEQLDRISNSEIDWKQVLRDFWRDFSAALGETKDLRTTEVLDELNEVLAPHIFPPKADGADPRACPICGNGQLSLKLGKFGAFIGCSNYPECRYTRQLMASGGAEAESFGDEGTPGGPASRRGSGERPCRDLARRPLRQVPPARRGGREGRQAEALLAAAGRRSCGDRPRAGAAAPGAAAAGRDAPGVGAPILVGIGRYGPYVQHGKTYANLEKDDDVLAIGANRAIDLIVAKESGAVYRRGGQRDPGRALGEEPGTGKTVVVKAGRFGPYVTDGEVNATLPRALSADAVTLDEAIALINARRAAGPAKKPRRGTRGGAKAGAKAPAPSAKAGAKKRTARKAGAKKAARKSASA